MTTYLITKSDLFKIVSDAKVKMSNISLPLYLSDQEVEQRELASVAILESVVMFLNSKGFLNQQLGLDVTDPGCMHDNELPLEQE